MDKMRKAMDVVLIVLWAIWTATITVRYAWMIYAAKLQGS